MAKRGRRLFKDRHKSFEALQPWLALGMSKSTWFRRRRQRRERRAP